jgi:hypothetical protein
MQDSWMSRKADEIEEHANRNNMKSFVDALKSV